MPDIGRSSHLIPSRPTAVSLSEADDEGTYDDRTLADVLKGKNAKTSQEGLSSPGGDSLPRGPPPRNARLDLYWVVIVTSQNFSRML
jgi:hypothetical protein